MNAMVKFTFSFFGVNLTQEIKFVSLSQKLVPRLIEYAGFNGDVHFFCFRTKILVVRKFASKIQNY